MSLVPLAYGDGSLVIWAGVGGLDVNRGPARGRDLTGAAPSSVTTHRRRIAGSVPPSGAHRPRGQGLDGVVVGQASEFGRAGSFPCRRHRVETG
jgi:hypothetical protein